MVARKGGGGGGGGVWCCEVCKERGEPKIQTSIMVLLLGVDIIEFVIEGKKMVMAKNHIDTHREVGEEVSLEEECEQLSWEESCLLRFSKFLGMSPEGYEDEVLGLVYKISDRRQR